MHFATETQRPSPMPDDSLERKMCIENKPRRLQGGRERLILRELENRDFLLVFCSLCSEGL